MADEPRAEEVSRELASLFKLDQAERTVGYENIDFPTMRANDKVRLQRAREIYAEVKASNIILAGEDLYHLAMLFQHSPEVPDYLTARKVADMAADKGSGAGKLLSAAAEDRYLLAVGEKQKWGTQFKREGETWEQFPMQEDAESGITDDMRKERGVPARKDQVATFLARKDI